MGELVRRAFRGRFGIYLKFLPLLLAAAIAQFVLMSMTGCDGHGGCDAANNPVTQSSGSRSVQAPAYTIAPVIGNAVASAPPGARTSHTFRCDGMAAGSTAIFTWSPPTGAFEFAPSRAPDPGGPPFVWRNLAPGATVDVAFNLPNTPAGVSPPWQASECLAVVTSDGQEARAVHDTLMAPGAVSGAEDRMAADPTPAGAASAGTIWELARWFDFPGQTMKTATCESWFGFLRSDKAFFALRVPAGQAGRLPFVTGAGYPSSLRIYRYVPMPSDFVYTATLQLRPERLSFVASALPHAEGEQWLPLGVAPGGPACPVGLNLQYWSLMANLFVDLSGQPNACAGCTFPLYYCYEGQSSPLAAAAMSEGGAGAASYAGWGITCAGPQSVRISTGPGWALEGSSSAIVTTTQTVKFLHNIWNGTTGPLSFTLAYDSSPAITWRVYSGTTDAPNLSKPITLPITVPKSQMASIWFVSGTLPGQTPAGAYSLAISAWPVAAPAQSQWASDLLWVGAWVAPPSGAPSHRVYLPGVVKNLGR